MNWISIKDQMPPEQVPVLVYPSWRRTSIMDVGYWFTHTRSAIGWNIAGTSGGGIGKDVTHWMPLPDPPEV